MGTGVQTLVTVLLLMHLFLLAHVSGLVTPEGTSNLLDED